jgi:hypothetical protein
MKAPSSNRRGAALIEGGRQFAFDGPQSFGITPAVMLSPKARSCVALIVGVFATITENLHEAVCCLMSVAVHVTVDVPAANAAPLGGVQVKVTGAAPPVIVGAG